MPVTRKQKEEILLGLTEKMKEAKSVFFAKNLGLSVQDAQEMRRALRKSGNVYTVAKKTLIKKAAKSSIDIDVPSDALEGAAGAAFSMEDELAAVKTLANFAKKTEKIELTGGIFEGKIMNQSEVIALSKIPGKDELLAKMLGSMTSPLSGFVGVGNQLIAGFVRTLDGYQKQKAEASS